MFKFNLQAVASLFFFHLLIFKLIETDQFIFNNTNLLINKSKYDSISDIKSIDDKYILIKKFDSLNYQLDLNSINMNYDLLKIINSKTGITASINKDNKLVKIADCGQEFRLVLPNYPTIFYSADEIQLLLKTENQTEETIQELKGVKTGISKWVLYPSILVLVGILVFILIFWKKIFKKKNLLI